MYSIGLRGIFLDWYDTKTSHRRDHIEGIVVRRAFIMTVMLSRRTYDSRNQSIIDPTYGVPLIRDTSYSPVVMINPETQCTCDPEHCISFSPYIKKIMHFINMHTYHFSKQKQKTYTHSTLLSNKLMSRHRYKTRNNYKMTLEQIEANQATIMTYTDFMQGKMDLLFETMLSMAQKERNVEINVEPQTVVELIGSLSLRIPRVTNPEFRFVRCEGVHVPPPVGTPVINLGAQNHYATSSQHRSLYDDKDPYDAFFMTQ